MEIKIKHLILAALLLPACQPAEHKDTEKEAGTSVPSADTPSNFKEVLQAHGGLEKWEKLGSLQYELTSNGNKETHLIDLKNRKDLVKADRYTIGYDGAQVWVSPNKAAYPGKSARFYHNLYFYFLGIPFVLADPGVNYEQLKDMVLQDKNYKVIGITFGEGIGETPEDQYRLLINPHTNRMEWLLYTVTYFGGQPGGQFKALKYEDYQEHQGLLLPRKMTGFQYENGQIGEVRYSVTFRNLQLKEQQPDQQQFQMPENAEVDTLAPQ